MRTAAQTVREFIAAFVETWPTGDGTPLAGFFSVDAVYHNMPMPPVHGRPAIAATFTGFMRLGGRVGVDLIHLLADGPIVMTERVDHFLGPQRTVSLPVTGVTEVHDGLITAWRDYFDLAGFTAQLAG